MKSLQNKFLRIVISGIVLMAVAISAVSMYTLNSILRRDADMILDNMCQKEASLIDDTLTSIQKSVQVMERYIIQELPESSLIGNSAYRHKFTDTMEKMFSNIATSTKGAVAFYLRYNPELAPSTSGFFIGVEPDGKMVKYSPTDLSLYTPDDTQRVGWYYEAVNAGQAVWMDPYHNLNNDVLMVSYVIPLYKSDMLIGIVGMDLDFSVLTETVNNISVYENGCAHLLSSDGSVVYNDPMLASKHTEGIAGRHAESSATLQNGMLLQIKADYNDIQKDGITVLVRIAVISGLVLIISVLFSILTTSKIISPLKKLTAAAQQLAAGNTDIHVECKSNDEIGTLTTVFNQTVQQLHEYMGYINALAYRDSLTGVRNRTAYIDMAAQVDCRIQQGLNNVALVVADINGLKIANDTYGHDVGSELIVCATRIICGTFKHSPVFRIGGDEFVVILENDDFAHRLELINEMDRVCAQSTVTAKDASIPVSIARGLAVYDHDIDTCIEDVFNRADKEMYIHKDMIKKAAKFDNANNILDSVATDDNR